MSDFVIIANAWSASVDNPTSKHQVALELARQGHRVLWVECAGMRVPRLGSSTDRSRIVAKISVSMDAARMVKPGIWHVAPLALPFPGSAMIRRFNAWLIRRRIDSELAKLAFVQPALINFMPIVPRVMRWWPWEKVYYCVDRWDQFNLYNSKVMGQLDRECCECADLVIASAVDLYERCRVASRNTFMISHGVDHERFAKAMNSSVSSMRPSDLPPGKVIGFIGLISEWVDQDLLLKLAGQVTEATIVMIGRADVATERLQAVDNIKLLGPKPFDLLPGYVNAFDVGIIPFIVNELTRAVNPIKLKEMLAAGCPVVSTALPEVESLRTQVDPDGDGCLRTANSNDEFVEIVKERLENPLTHKQRQALSNTMKDETWEAKVIGIVKLVGSC